MDCIICEVLIYGCVCGVVFIKHSNTYWLSILSCCCYGLLLDIYIYIFLFFLPVTYILYLVYCYNYLSIIIKLFTILLSSIANIFPFIVPFLNVSIQVVVIVIVLLLFGTNKLPLLLPVLLAKIL